MRALLAALLCAAGFALALPVTSASASAPPPPKYPVVWSFLPEATITSMQGGPDLPPPGSDVPCTLTAAHPYPVILVHGFLANQNDDWGTLSPYLADNGYCVYSATFGNMTSEPRPFDQLGGLTPMEESAHQLAWFVQLILAGSHAKKVDLIGHSEGGTFPDYYLKFLGGSKYVASFISLSGLMHGDTMFGLASLYDLGETYGFSQQMNALMAPLCGVCTEFLKGSSFVDALDAPNPQTTPSEAATCPFDGAAVDGIDYTSIATEVDELVHPYDSDFLDPRCASAGLGIGVHDITLQDQCPTDLADHLSVEADKTAAQDVLNALDPATAKPVPCGVTLPSVG